MKLSALIEVSSNASIKQPFMICSPCSIYFRIIHTLHQFVSSDNNESAEPIGSIHDFKHSSQTKYAKLLLCSIMTIAQRRGASRMQKALYLINQDGLVSNKTVSLWLHVLYTSKFKTCLGAMACIAPSHTEKCDETTVLRAP